MMNPSDPIADVVGLLRPRTVLARSLYASGSWAISFEPFPHVRVGTVSRGECWLALDGSKPQLLRAGDFFLLGNPPRYVMGSSLTAKPRAERRLWGENDAARIGQEAEEDVSFCSAHFSFDDPNAPLLLGILPPLVHVGTDDSRSSLLHNLSDLLVNEMKTRAVGSALVLDHLAQVIFVHMLRAHTHQADRPKGWLGALGDERIGAALRAMHADVARRWTLEELANIANLSRSAFAASFKSHVGRAPLDYLIQWRMSLARDALRHDSRALSELAFAIGYESESAFSTAFRRVVGSSPKQFRDSARSVTRH